MDGTVLLETEEEKDLGVLIDKELKFSRHIRGIVAKANRMIGLMKISFENIDKYMFGPLYNTRILCKCVVTIPSERYSIARECAKKSN